MRILIAGGFGYVGGRLAQHLHSSGHEIILGTRRDKRQPKWLHSARVAKMNWEDVSSLSRLCGNVDIVIHAAGMNAQECVKDPLAAVAFKGEGTERLAKAASRANVKKFFYVSTAHVYGAPLQGIIDEKSEPKNSHPYATSHLAGEDALLRFTHKENMVGIVMRLSNAVGAPAHKDADCWRLLVNDLCRQAVKAKSMTLRTSGLQQRDFITLSDVAEAVSHFIALQNVEGIFNIGSGEAYRLISMAELIRERCMHLFNFEPQLIESVQTEHKKAPNLNYRIDRLLQTGFSFSGNLAEEIDRTLLMCSALSDSGK